MLILPSNHRLNKLRSQRSAMWQAPESRIMIALSLNQADLDPNILA